MNKALPPIAESASALKQQMQGERDAKRQQRLHALYLIQSGQATTRGRVAELLGVHRNTVGSWLARYEAGGLMALLAIERPPGRVPTLNAAQREQLQTALSRPEGFASYGAIQRWIADELQVEMPYATVHHLVRYQLGAKLKRPRPSHTQKNIASASAS